MPNEFWYCVFCFPTALMVLAWWLLLRKQRGELRRISRWPAMICATLASVRGVWGIVHLNEYAKRSSLDYGFEGASLLYGFVGLVATIIWLATSNNKSKRASKWITLSVAGWMTFVWLMVASTI